MIRMQRALEAHVPSGSRSVSSVESADVVVLYVIGRDAIDYARDLVRNGKQYIAVQCCLHTAGGTIDEWREFWAHARLTWSYYDLASHVERFYHAPLGVDMVFRDERGWRNESRLYTAVTTGYVDGAGAEAIREAWDALGRLGLAGFHIGPSSTLQPPPPGWRSAEGITDRDLAQRLTDARYVCALRHVEGFELPAAEGIACGARPILFDQPTLRNWYGDWALYVPECRGTDLVEHLVAIFDAQPRPVTVDERRAALSRFEWSSIARGFWQHVFAQPRTHIPTGKEAPVASSMVR